MSAKEKKAKNLRVDPIRACKDRLLAIKDTMPINWKQVLLKHYPEYNTPAELRQIEYWWNLRSADLKLTEIAELIHAGTITINQGPAFIEKIVA